LWKLRKYRRLQVDRDRLDELAYRFFVCGSLRRAEYGGAPRIQYNDRHETDITPPEELRADVELFEKNLGVGFFHYGPRMWMLGAIEPLEALQDATTRDAVIHRIITEYPARNVEPLQPFYRVRKGPQSPSDHTEYDSPPDSTLGTGRFDRAEFPVLYASPDLELCVHECRIAAEDEPYVATLGADRTLRLLDLSVVLDEGERMTEFESLDMAVHLLFLAGRHSYEITRAIAAAAKAAGYDGLIYPSYFSQLRTGVMPLRTTLGISHRRVRRLHEQENSFSVPNFALFGRPIKSGLIRVKSINKLVISRVTYSFLFGPVEF
jgi:hypothetical protein